jgi:hypothetical protein
MRALGAYLSKTGNAKKVAEAIYEALDREKNIMPIGQMVDIGRYDLSFLGFPIKKSARIPMQSASCGSTASLPATWCSLSPTPCLRMPPNSLDGWGDSRTAAADANILGMFDS